MIYAAIGIFLLSMLACWLIARSRSADTRFWASAGLLLGPLAIPFAFFARPLPPNDRPPGG